MYQMQLLTSACQPSAVTCLASLHVQPEWVLLQASSLPQPTHHLSCLCTPTNALPQMLFFRVEFSLRHVALFMYSYSLSKLVHSTRQSGLLWHSSAAGYRAVGFNDAKAISSRLKV